MFGWEFPPYNSGGLGVACEGLVKALAKKGVEVCFVLPREIDCRASFCRFLFASPKKTASTTFFSAYTTFNVLGLARLKDGRMIYENDLFREVELYRYAARVIAKQERHDLIHAHDWLTFPAGLEAKKASGRPLIVHIHATEFDRTGGLNPNSYVYEMERQGFEGADLIIAVSNFTRQKVVQHYGINPDKIRIVHNAVDFPEVGPRPSYLKAKGDKKMVLFLGRITLQKGPDYFLSAAQMVLQQRPNVIFVMAGSGDMQGRLIEKAAEFGMEDKVFFPGFLRGEELTRMYQAADLYVLPSVSEPFGITPLEALRSGVPVLISKQSGVAEILNHCLKVDFWDVEQMANKIIAVLDYEELYRSLRENGVQEVRKISWDDSAQKCLEVYNEVLTI